VIISHLPLKAYHSDRGNAQARSWRHRSARLLLKPATRIAIDPGIAREQRRRLPGSYHLQQRYQSSDQSRFWSFTICLPKRCESDPSLSAGRWLSNMQRPASAQVNSQAPIHCRHPHRRLRTQLSFRSSNVMECRPTSVGISAAGLLSLRPDFSMIFNFYDDETVRINLPFRTVHHQPPGRFWFANAMRTRGQNWSTGTPVIVPGAKSIKIKHTGLSPEAGLGRG